MELSNYSNMYEHQAHNCLEKVGKREAPEVHMTMQDKETLHPETRHESRTTLVCIFQLLQ